MAAAPAFDEMYGHGGMAGATCRDAYTAIQRWLEGSPPEVMAARRRQAELFFRRIGITFAVYGDPDATERLIPFDIVPRILARSEWNTLERGLKQRVAALNMFLTDVYGPRDILRAGIVPEDLVLMNPGYCLHMAGRKPPGGVWVHIAGIDLVRTDAHEFYVLEDNARTPSGVSYMLENREVMLKLTIPVKPDLYAPLVAHPRVARVVALSGGFRRDEACVELEKNHGMIASFSRALLSDLRADMSDDELDATLGTAIDQICGASAS